MGRFPGCGLVQQKVCTFHTLPHCSPRRSGQLTCPRVLGRAPSHPYLSLDILFHLFFFAYLKGFGIDFLHVTLEGHKCESHCQSGVSLVPVKGPCPLICKAALVPVEYLAPWKIRPEHGILQLAGNCSHLPWPRTQSDALGRADGQRGCGLIAIPPLLPPPCGFQAAPTCSAYS